MTSDSMQRAEKLLWRMTIEEKAFQLTAVMPMGLMGSNGPIVSELERQIGHGIGQISAAGQFGGSSPAHLARRYLPGGSLRGHRCPDGTCRQTLVSLISYRAVGLRQERRK